MSQPHLEDTLILKGGSGLWASKLRRNTSRNASNYAYEKQPKLLKEWFTLVRSSQLQLDHGDRSNVQASERVLILQMVSEIFVSEGTHVSEAKYYIPHGERRHETNHILSIFRYRQLGQLSRVKVRGVVFLWRRNSNTQWRAWISTTNLHSRPFVLPFCSASGVFLDVTRFDWERG